MMGSRGLEHSTDDGIRTDDLSIVRLVLSHWQLQSSCLRTHINLLNKCIQAQNIPSQLLVLKSAAQKLHAVLGFNLPSWF